MDPRPLFLGFYKQKVDYVNHETRRTTIHPRRSQFIPFSHEGIDLKLKKWGDLDESLSFLRQPFQIVGSSNGFLLCCTDPETNMNYVVCNPVTKEFKFIPPPCKPYYYAVVIFICEVNHMDVTLSGTSFRIVRTGTEHPNVYTHILETDTFSSDTGEWTVSSTIAPDEFDICHIPKCVLVHENLMIFRSTMDCLVIFDPSVPLVEFIGLPPEDTSYHHDIDLLGKSDGKIHLCRSNTLDFEVWMLEDIQGDEWSMKCKVAIHEIFQQNPHVMCEKNRHFHPQQGTVHHFNRRMDMGIHHFHPQDSSILLSFVQVPYWYNFSTGRLSEVVGYGAWYTPYTPSFIYEWPWSIEKAVEASSCHLEDSL